MEPPVRKEDPLQNHRGLLKTPVVLRIENLASRVSHREVRLGRGRQRRPRPAEEPSGRSVASGMMNFPHRLHCLEADGKMEFGVRDVLLVSAHVEGRGKKQEQADQEVKCPRSGAPTVSQPLGALCVVQNARVVCSGIPGWGLYRHLPSVGH